MPNNNQHGTINKELELAGILSYNEVLTRMQDLTELTTAIGTNNIPALS